MGPFVVARRPDNEQHLACMPANALEAQLAIEETRQCRQIDAMLGDVRLALGFVEGNHCQIVDALYQEVKENCRCD